MCACRLKSSLCMIFNMSRPLSSSLPPHLSVCCLMLRDYCFASNPLRLKLLLIPERARDQRVEEEEEEGCSGATTFILLLFSTSSSSFSSLLFIPLSRSLLLLDPLTSGLSLLSWKLPDPFAFLIKDGL